MLGYFKDALIVNCKADNYVNPNPIANEDISMFYDLLATNKLNTKKYCKRYLMCYYIVVR